jgi:triosephosphate isomerase
MARQVLIAGNWKLNCTVSEGTELVKAIVDGLPSDLSCEVLVCPTFLGVSAAVAAADGSAVQVGGQNCYWEAAGAFTAEVSAPMLKDAGCSAVILGHSERRQYFGETDETINKRLGAALEAGLVPVVCIGETLEEREGGKLEEVLATQIKGSLAGFSAEQLKTLVIAYEPVWAIGTGVVATTEQAQEAHAFVRSVLREVVGELAEEVRILYGGSVKPGNAGDLMGQADIDGALVGGASLKAVSFLGIITA